MKLKRALEKSVKQWTLMVDNPNMTKGEAYVLAGGVEKTIGTTCFLCDSFIFKNCSGCLSWNTPYQKYACMSMGSPYSKWSFLKKTSDEKLKATKKVLNYLKNELEKI